MIDWGLGQYERTAAELEPVAVHAVRVADPRRGERVVDLATGTGNAALVSARAGAAVAGVDAAERLIAVARHRAAAAGVEVDFRVGDVESLPFEDDSFDVALSIFGLIFASNAPAAFGEMMRVLRRGGRAVVSVWIPAGPIDAMAGVFGRAVAAASGFAPKRFAWHDEAEVRALATPFGADVRFHPGELTIEAESPEAYLAAGEEHPLSVAGRPILDREGIEDPGGFRVRSPYVLIEIRRAWP